MGTLYCVTALQLVLKLSSHQHSGLAICHVVSTLWCLIVLRCACAVLCCAVQPYTHAGAPRPANCPVVCIQYCGAVLYSCCAELRYACAVLCCAVLSCAVLCCAVIFTHTQAGQEGCSAGL